MSQEELNALLYGYPNAAAMAGVPATQPQQTSVPVVVIDDPNKPTHGDCFFYIVALIVGYHYARKAGYFHDGRS